MAVAGSLHDGAQQRDPSHDVVQRSSSTSPAWKQDAAAGDAASALGHGADTGWARRAHDGLGGIFYFYLIN